MPPAAPLPATRSGGSPRLAIDDPELEPTDAAWNYRSRITLAVDTAGPQAGFHRIGDAGGIFALVRCEIADERLNSAWRVVSAAAAEWPAALSHIVLRLGRDDRVHVVFRGPVKPATALGRRRPTSSSGGRRRTRRRVASPGMEVVPSRFRLASSSRCIGAWARGSAPLPWNSSARSRES